MIGFPEASEAAPYYFQYIDRVSRSDVVEQLDRQLGEMTALMKGISEEKSLHRYQPDKWSIRQLVSHVNDSERVFLSRAFWFARGFDSPLPSFDEKVSAQAARADAVPWADLVDEFAAVRRASVTFLRGLPADAWMRSGIASGNPFTVRALAHIIAGHTSHHAAILRERYL